MKKLTGFLILLILMAQGRAQIETPVDPQQSIQDSLKSLSVREIANDSLKIHRPVISDYTFWTQKNQKPEIIDTVLTIESFYNQNFIQKDLFGKMYFPNFGQTFNPLIYEEKRFINHLLPEGKSFNYIYSDDIRYYDVKTPMTEFVFENGLREGQYLSTSFAHNLTPNWNYSVRYRGLRSMGRYVNNLAANNAFIATISHQSKNERLKIWSHYASQNIDNQENAGIADLNEFVNDDELSTTNRQNIQVNLKTAHTEYDSRRFLAGGSYALFGKSKSDSVNLNAPIVVKNIFSYEKQKYFYKEKQAEDYYDSPVFSGFERKNLKSFESLQNTSSIEFKWGESLFLEAGLRYENLKLYSPETLTQGLTFIPGQIEDQLIGGVGKLYFDWNDRLKLSADAEFNSGDFFKSQYHFNAELDIQPLTGYHLVAGAMAESAFPSLNLFYHQSFYKDFNYYNYSFQNTKTQKLYGQINLKKLNSTITANLYNIEDFVFVDSDFRPKQLTDGISLFQVRGDVLIPYRKFNLRATVQYQKVTQNEAYLPLPDLIARATVFWQSKVFDGKAEMQIGLNANYFTEFQSREFFPVTNEFMIQRVNPDFGIQKIGGYPILDFFINMKVDRMRIYLRADHFNAMWGENNYYSAPFTPFRDFKFQIGFKWYLFT